MLRSELAAQVADAIHAADGGDSVHSEAAAEAAIAVCERAWQPGATWEQCAQELEGMADARAAALYEHVDGHRAMESAGHCDGLREAASLVRARKPGVSREALVDVLGMSYGAHEDTTQECFEAMADAVLALLSTPAPASTDDEIDAAIAAGHNTVTDDVDMGKVRRVLRAIEREVGQVTIDGVRVVTRPDGITFAGMSTPAPAPADRLRAAAEAIAGHLHAPRDVVMPLAERIAADVLAALGTPAPEPAAQPATYVSERPASAHRDVADGSGHTFVAGPAPAVPLDPSLREQMLGLLRDDGDVWTDFVRAPQPASEPVLMKRVPSHAPKLHRALTEAEWEHVQAYVREKYGQPASEPAAGEVGDLVSHTAAGKYSEAFDGCRRSHNGVERACCVYAGLRAAFAAAGVVPRAELEAMRTQVGIWRETAKAEAGRVDKAKADLAAAVERAEEAERERDAYKRDFDAEQADNAKIRAKFGALDSEDMWDFHARMARERDALRTERDQLHAKWRECADALAVAAMERDQLRANAELDELRDRLQSAVDEQIEMSPTMTAPELVSRIERGLFEIRRDLQAAVVRAEAAEAKLTALGTREAAERVYTQWCGFPAGTRGEAIDALVSALAAELARDVPAESAQPAAPGRLEYDGERWRPAVTRAEFDGLRKCLWSLLEAVNWANNHACYDDDVHDNPEHDRTRATVKRELSANRLLLDALGKDGAK